MQARAVVLEQPQQLSLTDLDLDAAGPADAVVAVRWSGISTGTERLLWSGRMPAFPGMGYPLVPGYESVGEVVEAGFESGLSVGQTRLRPRRALLRRRCAASSAAPPPTWSAPAPALVPLDADAGRARHPDRAGRHRLSRPAQRGSGGRAPSSSATASSAACSPASRSIAGGLPDRLGDEPDPGRGQPRLRGDRPGLRRASRLRQHHGRERRRQPPRHPDRPPGARRRGRAGGLLRGTALLRLPARLHARGPHPRRREWRRRPHRGHGARRVRARCPRRPHHPSQPGRGCGGRPTHGLRRSRTASR